MTHSFPTRRSSDLGQRGDPTEQSTLLRTRVASWGQNLHRTLGAHLGEVLGHARSTLDEHHEGDGGQHRPTWIEPGQRRQRTIWSSSRSEEHTSELQSLMRISYAVFCLKKKHNPCRTERRRNTRKHVHVLHTRCTTT